MDLFCSLTYPLAQLHLHDAIEATLCNTVRELSCEGENFVQYPQRLHDLPHILELAALLKISRVFDGGLVTWPMPSDFERKTALSYTRDAEGIQHEDWIPIVVELFRISVCGVDRATWDASEPAPAGRDGSARSLSDGHNSVLPGPTQDADTVPGEIPPRATGGIDIWGTIAPETRNSVQVMPRSTEVAMRTPPVWDCSPATSDAALEQAPDRARPPTMHVIPRPRRPTHAELEPEELDITDTPDARTLDIVVLTHDGVVARGGEGSHGGRVHGGVEDPVHTGQRPLGPSPLADPHVARPAALALTLRRTSSGDGPAQAWAGPDGSVSSREAEMENATSAPGDENPSAQLARAERGRNRSGTTLPWISEPTDGSYPYRPDAIALAAASSLSAGEGGHSREHASQTVAVSTSEAVAHAEHAVEWSPPQAREAEDLGVTKPTEVHTLERAAAAGDRDIRGIVVLAGGRYGETGRSSQSVRVGGAAPSAPIGGADCRPGSTAEPQTPEGSSTHRSETDVRAGEDRSGVADIEESQHTRVLRVGKESTEGHAWPREPPETLPSTATTPRSTARPARDSSTPGD
ncbi:hypothetical protein AURDEDRAFT_166719 [Auricularia subglabra TFB-10046 SS5]|nr:hypothetical protein AURDEDRAFT_166719 [Auricularia subglabra TFB-10046 SS5]